MSKILLICGLLASQSVSAQNKVNQHPVSEEQSVVQTSLSQAQMTKVLRDELDGTYEFEISLANYNPLITYSMLEAIKVSRLDDSNAYIQWDDYTTIVVFPRTVIEQVENL